MMLIAVGLLALAWRLGFLFRLRSSILFGDLNADSAAFWAWSARILHGTLASSQPFFFGPLYAYWLAVVRLPAPQSIELVRLIQYLLGTAVVLLLTDAAHRLIPRRAALVIGIILALNPMLVFFDSLVLMESLLLFLQALLLWMVIAAGGKSFSWLRALLAGVLIGVLSEGRAIFAILLVPMLGYLLHVAGTHRDRIRPALALLLGAAAIVSLSLIHNVRAGGEWIPFTYSLGYNLYVGNHPNASGTFTTITGTSDVRVATEGPELDWSDADGRSYIQAETGRRLSPQQSSSYWAARAEEFIQRDPPGAALGFGKRVLMLWNRHEYPQIENADEYRTVCGPLGLPVVGGFGFLAICSLIGISDAWRSGATARWLLANLALLTLGTAMFFVTDRYRCQLIPATAIVAAWGIERMFAAVRTKQLPRSAWIGLLAGLAVIFAPLPYVRGARYEWGLNADLGSRWLGRDPSRAIEFFSRAIALESSGRLRWQDNDEGRLERAVVYHGYARALQRTGAVEQAVAFERDAARLAPQSKAIQAAWSAMSQRMQVAGGLTERAWGAAQRNEFALAESLFSSSIAADPHQPDSWAALIRLRVQRGDMPGAQQALRQATEFGLSGSALILHKALISAAARDYSTARSLLSQVPPEDAADPVLASVRQAVMELMRRAPGP